MFQRLFWVVIAILLVLLVLTNPVLVQLALEHTPTATPTSIPPTSTATPTYTPDPFANIPTATPQTKSGAVAVSIQELPNPLGDLPPTFTPTPAVDDTQAVIELLPDPELVYRPGVVIFQRPSGEMPAGVPPGRIKIDRVGIDTSIQPAGMMPVQLAIAGNFVAPAAPAEAVAGWLDVSAPFGRPGNTVISARREVFDELWLLEAGDEITLFAPGEAPRRYIVQQSLVLPEQTESPTARQANAVYSQTTADERLTLVTGSEQGNTYRTIIVAYPQQGKK